MRAKLFVLSLLTAGLVASGCASAQHHANAVREATEGGEKTTIAKAQKLKKGMSGSEVVEALGSPNVITTDENGCEVWVYDKISTDVVYSAGGDFLLDTGARSTTQRTMTVVVKFDSKSKVRDFAYRASSF